VSIAVHVGCLGADPIDAVLTWYAVMSGDLDCLSAESACCPTSGAGRVLLVVAQPANQVSADHYGYLPVVESYVMVDDARF
jgi:hypothetical protein